MVRNTPIAANVGRLSRSSVFAKRGNYKGTKTGAPKAKEETPATIEKTVGGEKNGGKRVIPTNKASKYYPAEDIPTPKQSRKNPSKTKLRSSITPGTVVIILAGRYRGKRVVFLKQLESGLLLVNGPFRVNGVPLRRVAQSYVIATSTKVDLSDVKLPESLNDSYFTKSKTASKEDKEAEFFGGDSSKKLLSDDRKSEQKSVDSSLLAAIKKVDHLSKYLSAPWALSKGDKPHEMSF